MPLKLANNAISRLSAGVSAAVTTLAVSPGDGAKFPALSAGDWFPLTLVKADGTLEIVRCTARSSDSFTVVRAQEGTEAAAFSAGDRIELRSTKAAMDSYAQLESPALTGAPTAPTPLATDASTRVQTTAGSLALMQQFGIGAAGAQATSDLNAHRTGGVFTADATVSAAAGLTLALQHIVLYLPGLSNLFGAMFATGLTSNPTNGRRVFFRKLNSGTWQPWQEYSFLDSPAFTGVPVAPTAAAGTNTTQLATTAFVTAATPDATTLVKGKVALATDAATLSGTATDVAVPPSGLKAYVDARTLGVNQSWQDVSASRVANTNYTNTNGRPIVVFASLGSAALQTTRILVAGVVAGSWVAVGSNVPQGACAIVPPGAIYRVQNSDGGSTVLQWSELR